MLWWRVTEQSGKEFYVNLGEVTHIMLPDKETPGGMVAFTNGGFLKLKEQEDRLQLIEDVVLQSSKVDRHQIKTLGTTEKVTLMNPVQVREPIGRIDHYKRPMRVTVELDSPYLKQLKWKVIRRWHDVRWKLGRFKPWG